MESGHSQDSSQPPLPPTGDNCAKSYSASPKSSYAERYNALALPFLTFSNHLKLTSINRIGESVLGVSMVGKGQADGLDAAQIFTENGMDLGVENAARASQSRRRDELSKLKEMFQECAERRSSTQSWYEGVAISYWTGVGKRRKLHHGEAIIQAFLPSSSTVTYPTTFSHFQARSSPDSPNSIPDSAPSPDHHHFSVLLLREIITPVISSSTSLNEPMRPSSARISPPTIPISTREALSNFKPTLDDVAPQLTPYFEGETADDQEDYKDYKKIVDLMPQICFTTDIHGIVSYFNKYWFDFTGLDPNDGPESGVHYFHPIDILEAHVQWKICLSTREEFACEYRVRTARGLWRWQLAKGKCVRDEEGNIKMWNCTMADVEELVQVRLPASNLFAQVRSKALRIKEHISAALSGAACTCSFRFQRALLIGRPPLSSMIPFPSIHSDLVLITVDRSSFVTFYDGSASLESSEPSRRRNSGSNVIGMHLRDVWLDENMNEAVRKMLDEESPEAASLTADRSETSNQHAYRYRLVPLRACPSAPELLTSMIIVIADITQIVTAEREAQTWKLEKQVLIVSEHAAQEHSRLKTSFVTDISHELRTPVASIIGIAEILLEDSSLKKNHRTLVAQALRSGEILLDLIGKMLDMGKIESGKLILDQNPFHLSDVILDAELSVMARKKGVEFIEDIEPYFDGYFEGDKIRLRQILWNGLSNAAKFTHTGSITLSIRQQSESEIESVLVFSIQDTGVGIKAQVLPTLFVPFQQADSSTAREYGESGLGLVIAKNLVELMGGSIALESTLGIGTSMIIRLPLKKKPAAVIRLPRQNATAPMIDTSTLSTKENFLPPPESMRILVAEDNAPLLEIVMKLLKKSKVSKLTLVNFSRSKIYILLGFTKFQVEGVKDGVEAVQAVRDQSFDLILMDGQMPRLSGYDATAQIRQMQDPVKSKIKIIAFTASAFEGDKERCLAAGMDDYLTKPVRNSLLTSTIFQASSK